MKAVYSSHVANIRSKKTWQHDAYQNARRADWDAEIIGDQPLQID